MQKSWHNYPSQWPAAKASLGATPAPRPATHVAEAEIAEAQLHDLFRTWKRRRWLIVGLVLAGTTLATLISLVYPVKYVAKAQLLVAIDPAAAGGKTSDPMAIAEAVDTHIASIQSLQFHDYVIAKLKAQASARGGQSAEGALTASTLPTRRTLDRNLTIMQERRSSIITIAYAARQPELAALVANQISQLYIDWFGDRRHAYGREELARLAERIEQVRKTLDKRTRSASPEAAGHPGTPSGRVAPAPAEDVNPSYDGLSRLLKRKAEVEDDVLSEDLGIRQMASAVPPDLVSSISRLMFVVPAFMLSLIGSFMFAVLLDRMDRSLRTVADAQAALGVKCLGLLPEQPRHWFTTRASASEASWRASQVIRSAIVTLGLIEENAPRLILITSTVGDEGVPDLTQSLARSLAALNRKVAIVHAVDEPDDGPYAPSGDIAGDHDGGQAASLVTTASDGADIVHLEQCGDSPLGMYSDGRLQALFTDLQATYDCLLLEAPPVTASASTRVLHDLAEMTLFAVRLGHTDRSGVLKAISDLGARRASHTGPARQLFTILTRAGRKPLRQDLTWRRVRNRIRSASALPSERPAASASRPVPLRDSAGQTLRPLENGKIGD